MSHPITFCAPNIPSPCLTPRLLPPLGTALVPLQQSFVSNHCQSLDYGQNQLCKVSHSLPISSLKKVVLSDFRFLLSDPSAVAIQKQKRLEAFRRADVRINAFCLQVGSRFVEVRFRPSILEDTKISTITAIEERPHDQPRARYVSVATVIDGEEKVLKLRVPFGWEAAVGDTVAVTVFDEMPQNILGTYVHPVQVQSQALAVIAANTTESERKVMAALEDVMNRFNHLIFESGREEFWLPEMSIEERAAFDQSFPDTEMDHPGGNHPLRYAGTIVVRSTDPSLKHVPKEYQKTSYAMRVGDREVTYYAVPISQYAKYRHRIAKLADAIEAAGRLLPVTVEFSEYLSEMAKLLRSGDVFGMTHLQLGYYAKLAQKIQEGRFDSKVDSSVVFWMVWRGWRASPFVHTFLGAACLNAAGAIESELGSSQGSYQNSLNDSDIKSRRLMSEAVRDGSVSHISRVMGTLVVTPQSTGAHLSNFPAVGGVNMYTVTPGEAEHHLNVIISDSVRMRATAAKAAITSMFGEDTAQVSDQEIAALLELIVTRHERGHANGADFLNNTSDYKPALEEARADILALRAASAFAQEGLLNDAQKKAYIQLALSHFFARYLNLADMKKADGSWNEVLFGYGDQSQPHAVGRTFIARFLLNYAEGDQRALRLVELDGRVRLEINDNLFPKAADAFLRAVTQYLNAAKHEEGIAAWNLLTEPFARMPPQEPHQVRSMLASMFAATIVRS